MRSSLALLGKELRSLLPLLVLVLLVHGVDLLHEPFTTRLDEKQWADAAFYPGHGFSSAMVLMILALMAGYSLFPREHDDGTIHFLHSLPVSRTRIFLAKVSAGAFVLVAGVVVGGTTNLILSAANTSSLEGHQATPQLFFGIAFLYSAYSLFIFAHGVFLSFFRRFGFVLYGVAAWIVIALQTVPSLALLDPTRLCSFEYDGAAILFPWRELGVHATVALVALVAAWFLWTGPGERVGRAFLDTAARPWGKVLLGCGTALIVGLVSALVIFAAYHSRSERPEDGVHWAEHEAAVPAETPHFRFTYPANLRERALVLIRGAEETYESLRALLGARDGAPIVADLTEVSEHHAGIASWQKIRMGLSDETRESSVRLRSVFHHEVAHAFQFQESADKVKHEFGSTQFFCEGGAEWAAFETVPQPETRLASRRQALAAVRNHKLRFDDLCDAHAFAARHDKDLVYPVGETWVAALAAAHGRDAPGRVLRAMARADAPRGLEPLAFWQDTLQASGYDLERVIDAWVALLADVEAKSPGFVESIPRLRGGVSRAEADSVVLVATLDRDPIPGSTYVLKARANAGSSDEEMLGATGELRDERTVEFRLTVAHLPGRQFEFAFGVWYDARVLPSYEDWQAGAVPR